MAIQTVGVVGAGTIGTGWATFLASKGIRVQVYDSDPNVLAAAKPRVAQNLDLLVVQGLITQEAAESGKELVHVTRSLEEAVMGAGLVQESVLETYETKRDVFRQLDAAAPPEVPLCSSSSGLLMSRIQDVARHPERCLIAHPINPVYLIPLVELVPGDQTSPAVVEAVRGFLAALGKVPVALRKEVPGYLENRLTAALWREAIDLVNQGVASVEDVDKAIWAGPGLRYALMGPLLIYHLGGGAGGVDHFIKHLGPAFTQWWSDMNTWTEIPAEAIPKLRSGLEEAMNGRTIADVCAWRDRRLVDLVKLLYPSAR